MKLRILGCGNAFSDVNFNQCFLIEENGKKFLIDYGYQAPHALKAAGVSVKDIDAVYISHQHADHIGGLEQMAFLRYDWVNHPTHYSQGKYAPKLIANKNLMKDLWEHSLQGGLRSMEGFDASLETFFETMAIEPNQTFRWEGMTFSLVQQIHVMTGSVIMNTFGLFIETKDGKKVYCTTDSQHCSPKQVEVFYRKADVIFQDCECLGVDTLKKEYKFGSGVHANYAQLAGYPSANSIRLSDDVRAKMWLSHYQDFVNGGVDGFGNPCDWQALAKADGFQGFLHVGQEFEF